MDQLLLDCFVSYLWQKQWVPTLLEESEMIKSYSVTQIKNELLLLTSMKSVVQSVSVLTSSSSATVVLEYNQIIYSYPMHSEH